MEVQVYTISKSQLQKMPTKERNFFLLSGHLANEIVLLSKLLIISKIESEKKIFQHAELTQALFVQKTLAGKLYEGWNMIKKNYNSGISKEYDKLLDKHARDAIQRLRAYFGRKNAIRRVRNSYSFHYGPKEIGPTLDRMKDGDEFCMYVAEQHVNSLYYVSETVINKTMLYEVNANDIQEANNRLFEDIVNIHKQILLFINGFMHVAASRYFEKSSSNPRRDEIPDKDLVKLQNIRVPFFVDPNKLGEMRR